MAFEAIADAGKSFGRGLERGMASRAQEASTALAQQKLQSEQDKQRLEMVNAAMQETKASIDQLTDAAMKVKAAGKDPAATLGQIELLAKDAALTEQARRALIAARMPELAASLPPFDPDQFAQQQVERVRAVLSGTLTAEESARQDARAEGLKAQARNAAEGVTSVVSGNDPIGRSVGLRPGQQARVQMVPDGEGGVLPKVVEVIRPPDKGTTVVLPANETSFLKERGKGIAESINTIVDKGMSAQAISDELIQLAELAGDPELETGAVQPFVTRVQAIAESLGLSIGEDAFGKVSSKEEFNRLATRIVIEGFEQFKGNLNQTEVQLALDAFGGLGKTRESNRAAIAALMASSEIARRRGETASTIATADEAAAFQRSILGADRRKEFLELKRTFSEAMLRSAEPDPLPQSEFQAGQKQTANTSRSVTPLEEPQRPAGLPVDAVFDEAATKKIGKPAWRMPDGSFMVME